MHTVLCAFSPVACAATTVGKATLGDLFSSLTAWVVASVSWLLSAAGAVLTRTSDPATVVSSANAEFTALEVVAPLLMAVGLLVATLAALRHGDGASIWRSYLGVAPACVAAIALARPMASLILRAVDQLSGTAAVDVASREAALAKTLAAVPSSVPGFGLFLLAMLVVVGCLLLWCELIVRNVVLALLLVLVPVIVPLSTFPSLRRVGWRLAETFVAVSASKFFIVVVLALGLDEVTGDGVTQVMTGATTLLLATATPFVLLRVIPFVEASALHSLDGLRQRSVRAVAAAPTSPIAAAARALAPDAEVPGPPVRGDDLGIPTDEGDGDVEMPALDGERPAPPVGQPTLRGGHVVYGADEGGPYVGWHFDE
ncbi:MAG: hypothetical protein ACRDV0_01490 [Acidimicrobiales bacterium]